MNEEDVRKAFRILPHQGTGVYGFDSCSHGDYVVLKSSDPWEKVNICPECLALALSEDDDEVRDR